MTQEDRRARRITTAILLGASAVMFAPLVTDQIGQPIPMVRNLGLSPGSLAPAPAWIAALVFAVSYIAFTFRGVPSVRERQRELSMFKLVGVVAAVASGIMEEVVFRRFLMDWAAHYGLSSTGQVLASGLVFGLAHLSWHAFSRDWRHSLIAAAATTAAGFALAVIYLIGGRNLGPCIAAHFLINLVIEPWLVLDAVEGRRKAAT